jgi:hypothetical protein
MKDVPQQATAMSNEYAEFLGQAAFDVIGMIDSTTKYSDVTDAALDRMAAEYRAALGEQMAALRITEAALES